MSTAAKSAREIARYSRYDYAVWTDRDGVRHGATFMDPFLGGDRRYRWCFKCGGRWQPRGVLSALVQNARAERGKAS